jgi:hypothetical protein
VLKSQAFVSRMNDADFGVASCDAETWGLKPAAERAKAPETCKFKHNAQSA